MTMSMRMTLIVMAGCVVGACSRPDTPGNSVPGQRAGASATTAASDPRAEQVLTVWRTALDTLAFSTAQLDTLARAMRDVRDVATVREAFHTARRDFKRAELALEYYAPSTTRSMNGPPVPEVEETEGPETVFPPSGFQVLEEALFSGDPLGAHEVIARESGTLRELITRARTMMAAQHTTPAHAWDATRLELARVATLGLAGFDAAVSGHALPEAQAALDGVARTLAPFRTTTRTWQRLDTVLAAARAALGSAPTRESFDHLRFLTLQLQPLAHALDEARRELAIGVPVERRGFRMTAASVFDSGAFDAGAFAPLDLQDPPRERVALGQSLFGDVRLSGSANRSCRSCHAPARGFADGLKTPRGLDGTALARNTPTVINSGVQVGSFADLRTTFLEDQIADVVQNTAEMHGHLDRAALLLASDGAMAAQFRTAFPAPRAADSLVTAARIQAALAAYLRSLTRLDAPIDRALRGDMAALPEDARRGFNVFVGKARCASCHFLPLTNGTVPPMYQRSELEVLGVPARATTAGARVDPDPGRFGISRAEPHRYAFRTPSLRNVALTAPYMHNGAYPTLESVIEFYDLGGGNGIGLSLPNQTLPAAPLRLSATEKRDLVAFLRALTDTTGTQ
jgi:cytochrome c peroxidase